ncbi:MAG TPA: cytochrome c maturation protein CcmE [Flavilitoribacter sp.]|nr:cytochrome c maturation protein CcmE [Lewinella sp.]MCB9278418.1 cytochrome c maturation protein CcmE [Lewinellaceae bacterium]HMQ62887.1 cytochrome c maturation protein CcmE [Flavilitoribacter sp.]
MKKIHIVAIGMIAVAIFILSRMAGDMSSYATFDQAEVSGKKVKIAGELVKEKEMVYKPEEDPNEFRFYLRDTDGKEHRVLLLRAKPQDFELAEQIVLTGRMKGDEFVATDYLTKCPSKYKDEEVFLKEKKS